MGRRVQCCTVQGNSENFWPKKREIQRTKDNRTPPPAPTHPKKRNSDDQVLDKGSNGSKLTRRKRLFWLSSKAWSRVEGWFHNSYNIFLFCPRVFDRISVVFILNTKFQVLNWKKLIFFFCLKAPGHFFFLSQTFGAGAICKSTTSFSTVQRPMWVLNQNSYNSIKNTMVHSLGGGLQEYYSRELQNTSGPGQSPTLPMYISIKSLRHNPEFLIFFIS